MDKLRKIQESIGLVSKDGKGNYGKFATMNACMESLEPLLKEEKLSLTSFCDGQFVVTQVIDGDIVLKESKLPISYAKGVTPHDLGSAITYFRRYNLYMLFNILVDDDDGQGAQDAKNKAPQSVNTDDIL